MPIRHPLERRAKFDENAKQWRCRCWRDDAFPTFAPNRFGHHRPPPSPPPSTTVRRTHHRERFHEDEPRFAVTPRTLVRQLFAGRNTVFRRLEFANSFARRLFDEKLVVNAAHVRRKSFGLGKIYLREICYVYEKYISRKILRCD